MIVMFSFFLMFIANTTSRLPQRLPGVYLLKSTQKQAHFFVPVRTRIKFIS